MNDIVILVLLCFMGILSVILLSGRGSFLIAGYNTSSKEEKAQYNEKRLCRVVGGGLAVITLIMGIFYYYNFELPAAINWLVPWGIFAAAAIIMILASLVCRKK